MSVLRRPRQWMGPLDQRLQPLFQHVGIDLRRGDIGVAQELLQGSQVGAMGQKVAGEGMAEYVR